jgi:hypothetical protein
MVTHDEQEARRVGRIVRVFDGQLVAKEPSMLRNYLLTAWKVFMRRKLFTAINLVCIVLTLVVLMVITALLETAFWPSGVEGKSERFLQVYGIRSESADHHAVRTTLLGYKTIDKYLKPMAGVERVSAFTTPASVSVYQGDRVSELQMRRVDADYWKILDFKLLAGRLPDADDDDATDASSPSSTPPPRAGCSATRSGRPVRSASAARCSR